MKKIKEILVGTNNVGKYKEICALLPKRIKKFSPKEFKISTPREAGKSFRQNSIIKAKYFSKKTNLICLSDDSGLEIDLLNGAPGIYSARWGGKRKNFNLAIKEVFKKMNKKKKNWKNNSSAKFVCCLTLFWPNGRNYTTKGVILGKISTKKKGKKGFGYDPIFIPEGYSKTFGEINPRVKMTLDHRFKAFSKMKKFFF